MATISNWTEGLPSDTSLVVKGPAYMRSIWQSVAVGLDESLYWPGSGGGSNASQGELKPGASKAWFAAKSASSDGASATHRGRPFIASDESQLYTYLWETTASGRTQLIGTPFLQEHETYFDRAYWLEKSGSFVTTPVSAGVVMGGIVSLTAGEDYAGKPSVFVTSDNASVQVAADAIQNTQFTSRVSGAAVQITVRWVSLGTVNLPPG